MSPTTTDEVVDRLDQIVGRSLAEADRRGYFAALYDRVTRRVREGARRGEFQDGPRMERFDVLFAGRYLEAYDRDAAGEPPTRPWAAAFDAADREGLFVVQHLVLGMFAHIAFDLGLALAAFAAEAALPAMRDDYLRINDLLAEEVSTVEDELVEIAGRWQPDVGALLRLAERAAGGAARSAALVVMEETRAQAWDFAVRLVDAPDEDARQRAIERQELATLALAEVARLHAPVAAIAAHDGAEDVAENIRVLRRSL